mmetsp:Transcript_7188/g.16455  ORF Transcript_7188/g.16455 Transcript_7188/m.16455 type:complete len:288 (-) Transcript_7188:38-901(-)
MFQISNQDRDLKVFHSFLVSSSFKLRLHCIVQHIRVGWDHESVRQLPVPWPFVSYAPVHCEWFEILFCGNDPDANNLLLVVCFFQCYQFCFHHLAVSCKTLKETFINLCVSPGDGFRQSLIAHLLCLLLVDWGDLRILQVVNPLADPRDRSLGDDMRIFTRRLDMRSRQLHALMLPPVISIQSNRQIRPLRKPLFQSPIVCLDLPKLLQMLMEWSKDRILSHGKDSSRLTVKHLESNAQEIIQRGSTVAIDYDMQLLVHRCSKQFVIQVCRPFRQNDAIIFGCNFGM